MKESKVTPRSWNGTDWASYAPEREIRAIAPALIEALEAVQPILEMSNRWPVVRRQVNEALAKARGESK